MLSLVVIAACGDDDDDGVTTAPEPAASAGTVDTAPGSAGSDPAPPADDGGAFVIGAILPESGPFASLGEAARVGLTAGVNRVNAEGGILGRQVSLEIRDNGSDPQRAAAAARELVSLDDLGAIFPSVASGNVPAVLPITTEAGVLVVNACALPVCGDAAEHPLTFTVTAPVQPSLEPVFAAAKNAGAATIGIIGLDDDSGRFFQTFAEETAPEFDLEILSSQLVDPAALDYTPQLQLIRENEPDALLAWVTGGTIGVLMQGVADLGWDVPVFGPAAITTANLAEVVPPEVHDQLSAVTYRIGAREAADAVDAEFADIIDQLRAEGEITNLTVTALAYDTVMTMRYGYENAGTFDPVAAAGAIEGMVDDDTIEPGDFAVYPNGMAFDGATHSPANVDFSSGFWAIVTVSDVLDGTLIGQPIDF